jgi:hypothetical protein
MLSLASIERVHVVPRSFVILSCTCPVRCEWCTTDCVDEALTSDPSQRVHHIDIIASITCRSFSIYINKCAVVAFVRKLEVALVVPTQLFSSREVFFQSVCPRNMIVPPILISKPSRIPSLLYKLPPLDQVYYNFL